VQLAFDEADPTGRGKQRIGGNRRPGNPSLPFRPIVGGRPDGIRRRQIVSGFSRVFVVPAGFRVGLHSAPRRQPAIQTAGTITRTGTIFRATWYCVWSLIVHSSVIQLR